MLSDRVGFWAAEQFKILHVNIRGWVNHAAELAARITLMDRKPDPVCINETFLDTAVRNIELEGFDLVARRDRDTGQKCRGIGAFLSSSTAASVMLVMKSGSAERAWLMVHTERGPHLVGLWYRPPSPGEVASIQTFETEHAGLAPSCWKPYLGGSQRAPSRMAQAFESRKRRRP